MAKARETFNKKNVKDLKDKKRKEKERKKLERKESNKDGKSFEDMIMYVDENGQLTDTPPDPTKKKKIDLESIEISVPKDDDTAKHDPIRKGTVTFFNDDKGFGFIQDSINRQSVFVHINNCKETLKENNIVQFEIEMRDKGPVAINVSLVR